MSLIEFEPDRTSHPVDLVEHIASINDWTFERQDADEISISVRGGWSDYHVSFNWMEDLESLHIACAFDLKVPEGRRSEVKQLISLINEQLWIGHFDIWHKEGVVLFRNSHLLTGGQMCRRSNARRCCARRATVAISITRPSSSWSGPASRRPMR